MKTVKRTNFFIILIRFYLGYLSSEVSAPVAVSTSKEVGLSDVLFICTCCFWNCQALVPNPNPLVPNPPRHNPNPIPTQFQPQLNPKGTGADTKIL